MPPVAPHSGLCSRFPLTSTNGPSHCSYSPFYFPFPRLPPFTKILSVFSLVLLTSGHYSPSNLFVHTPLQRYSQSNPYNSLTKEPATNSAQSYRSQSDKLFQSIRTESLTLAAETNVEPGGLVFLCQSARVFVSLIPGQFFIPRGPDPESTVLEIWPTVRGTGQASCDRLVCSVLTHTPRSSASFFLREWISHLRHGDLGNRHQNPSGTTQCQLEGLIDRLSTIYPVPVLFMPPRLVLLETAAFQAGGRAL